MNLNNQKMQMLGQQAAQGQAMANAGGSQAQSLGGMGNQATNTQQQLNKQGADQYQTNLNDMTGLFGQYQSGMQDQANNQFAQMSGKGGTATNYAAANDPSAYNNYGGQQSWSPLNTGAAKNTNGGTTPSSAGNKM